MRLGCLLLAAVYSWPAVAAFRDPVTVTLSRLAFLPAFVVSADFNNDGLPDLAAANFGAAVGSIGINLNARSAPFSTQSELQTPGLPAGGVLAADLNRDGAADLLAIVAQPLGETAFCIAINNGSGAFNTPQCNAAGKNASAPVIADLNGDGAPDLAFFRAPEHDVFTMIGLGNGTFRAGPQFAVEKPTAIVAGDWTGDTALDLVIYSSTGTLTLARGTGGANFAKVTGMSAPLGGVYLAAGDLNRDGRRDLALIGSNNLLYVLLANATSFDASTGYPFPSGTSLRRLQLGDADGDGNLDVWVTAQQGVWIATTEANGHLVMPAVPAVSGVAEDFALADFNADGRLDIVIRSAGQAGPIVALRNASQSAGSLLLDPLFSTAQFGQPVRLTVKLTSPPGFNGPGTGVPVQLVRAGNPVGTALFTVASTSPQAPPTQEFFTAVLEATLPVGQHTLTAFYPGNPHFSAVTSTAVQATILPGTARVRVPAELLEVNRESPAPLAVVVESTGAPIAEGTVTLASAGRNIGSGPVEGGRALVRIAQGLPLGASRVTLTFESPNYGPATSPEFTLVVRGTITLGNAAQGRLAVARDSIATIALPGLSVTPQATETIPWPSRLSGVDVELPSGSPLAPLSYAGPNQINFLVPASAGSGQKPIRVRLNGVVIAEAIVEIADVAPGIFTANGAGTGVPAALAALYTGDQPEPVAVFDCATGACLPAPMPLGNGSQELIVSLYGTGLRNAAAPAIATLDARPADVLYAGAHPTIPGLDQVNVRIPRTLGAGEYDMQLTVDGRPANAVRLAIR